jgi:hypothetical protein
LKLFTVFAYNTVYQVVSEISWTVIVVTALVKEDERGG